MKVKVVEKRCLLQTGQQSAGGHGGGRGDLELVSAPGWGRLEDDVLRSQGLTTLC